MPNYYDPNDPDNPFSPKYKPRYDYEFHIRQPQKKPQFAKQPVKEAPTQDNSKLVTPYVELNTPLLNIPYKPSVIQWKNKFWIITGSIKLSFQGQIKSKSAILKIAFNGIKPAIAVQLQGNGNDILKNVNTQCNFDLTNLKKSSCTATISSNTYTSTSVSVDGGAPSLDVSTNDQGAGSSGVTLSPVSPTTMTFHFDSAEIKAQSGNSIMKGHLHLEVNLTCTPVDRDDTAITNVPNVSPQLNRFAVDQLIRNFQNDLTKANGYAREMDTKITAILATVMTAALFMVRAGEVLAEAVAGAV